MYKRGVKNIHKIVVALTSRVLTYTCTQMKRGAEPDRIDRRHGPAHQLTSHARLGEQCYRLYYYTYLSVVLILQCAPVCERRKSRKHGEQREKEREI